MTTRPRQIKYLNAPQMLWARVRAQKTVCIWGRGTGKSEGLVAPYTLDCIHAMPRSNGFLLGTTYEQLLTRTLPPLIAAWESYGYRKGVHFFIGKFAPPAWRWPRAFRYPEKPDHYIQWYNGTGIYLVSQDRPGTINGVRTHWGAGDEAKLLNYARVQEEVIPTMVNGQAHLWGHLPQYSSLLYCSDMPTTPQGRWLLDMEKEMDKEVIEAILYTQSELTRCQMKLAEATGTQVGEPYELRTLTGSQTGRTWHNRIAHLESALRDLRRDTTYVSYASTLDNVHVLGLDGIRQLRRNLDDLTFQTSVLNKRIIGVENGFYSTLSEDLHGYDALNYPYIDRLGLAEGQQQTARDARWFTDAVGSQPLDMACDYNAAINCVAVGQEVRQPDLWEYRLLNTMFVLDPLKITDAMKQFCLFYAWHPNKTVNFFYDNTANGRTAASNVSFADECMRVLREGGWRVNAQYVGQASSHHGRYLLYGSLFSEKDERLPRFRYNKTAAQHWAFAARQTPVLVSGEFFKKDKKSEKSRIIPPWEATHLTEAVDTLIYSRMRPRVGDEPKFFSAQVT